jgi:hypothetical protein
MVEKSILEASIQVTLAMPESGFSADVLTALSQACSKYERISKSYLVLKKDEENACLFFGFLFDDADNIGLVEQLMADISELFSEGVAFEGVCLNENKKLADVMQSMTSPFYQRESS